MKDQLRLLRDCINNDRPAVVFQGDDFCAPEILEAAKEIYRKHGCSEEFLFEDVYKRQAYIIDQPLFYCGRSHASSGTRTCL